MSTPSPFIFIYNGWFVFGVLALLLRQLEGWNRRLPTRAGRWWLMTWVTSCVLSYSLSALWTDPPMAVWVVGAFSGGLQLVAGGWLAGWLWQQRTIFQQWLRPWSWLLYRLAGLAFLGKVALQAVSALPWAAQWAYLQRPIVIAYLHLVFIGVVSVFLLGKAMQDRFLQESAIGLKTFIGFFIALELLLVAEPLLNRRANVSIPGLLPKSFLGIGGIMAKFSADPVGEEATVNLRKPIQKT